MNSWEIESAPRVKSTNPNITNLGFGATIEGKLILTEDSVINGAVKGDINSKGSLTIGDSATVQGNITGEDIRIAGTVNGNIQSSDRIELMAGANVVGDLRCKRLVIADGAAFEGRSMMEDEVPEFKSAAKIVDSSSHAAGI